MSDKQQDQPTDAEVTDEPPAGSVPAAESVPPASEHTDDDDTHPARQAARYRTQLREAEQQRDQLVIQLEAVRREQINAHAAALGIKPEALWASGVELESLLDERGVPAVDAVHAAVDAARTQLGIERPRKPVKGLHSGLGAPRERPNTWREAFTPRER